MSSDNFLSQLPSDEDKDASQSLDQVQEAISLAGLSPNFATFHIAFPTVQLDDPSISYVTPASPRSSSEGTVALSRRHFVVHGPSCGPAMRCDLRQKQSPYVAARSVGLPRCHIVVSSRDPVAYDRKELWARPLSRGPLIGVGDRVWLEGVGEVKLGETLAPAFSPYWSFFSAMTLHYEIIELAVVWGHVRLNEEEYERRVSFPYPGRGVGTPAAQHRSFLGFGGEDVGWVQRWISVWRGVWSQIVAICLHREVDPAA